MRCFGRNANLYRAVEKCPAPRNVGEGQRYEAVTFKVGPQ